MREIKIDEFFFVALDNFSYLCIRKVIHFGKLFLATKEKSFPKHKISAKDKTLIITHSITI